MVSHFLLHSHFLTTCCSVGTGLSLLLKGDMELGVLSVWLPWATHAAPCAGQPRKAWDEARRALQSELFVLGFCLQRQGATSSVTFFPLQASSGTALLAELKLLQSSYGWFMPILYFHLSSVMRSRLCTEWVHLLGGDLLFGCRGVRWSCRYLCTTFLWNLWGRRNFKQIICWN